MWTAINIVIVLVGLGIVLVGLKKGQKSEAYDCFGWLIGGCVLLFLGAVSIITHWLKG